MPSTTEDNRRLLRKTRRLSRAEESDKLPRPSISSRRPSATSTDVHSVENASTASLTRVSESAPEKAQDPSTASLLAVESTSSEAGSVLWTEQLQRKTSRISRQSGENIPPAAQRRQSLGSSTRSGTSTSDLKRSRSLWTRQQGRDAPDESLAAFNDRYARNWGVGSMSEAQRSLNVKRAKKMTQLFGQEPPQELIQIQDQRELESEVNRDSIFNPLGLLTAPLRDRANSTSSTKEVEEEPQAAVTPDTKDMSTFQERRRRAAKLSRFFGVGFQDISLGSQAPMPDVHVDVKTGGRRFWFNDRSKDLEGDNMQEAINRLRGLKAG